MQRPFLSPRHHVEDLSAQQPGFGGIVGDDQRGASLQVRAREADDGLAGGSVQPLEGLVHQNQRAVRQQGAENGDAPALPAAELAHRLVRSFRQASR